MAVKLIALLISVLIFAINYILAFAIKKFAYFEKSETITEYNISIAEKLTFAQFFNTALLTFTMEIIFFRNFYGNGN